MQYQTINPSFWITSAGRQALMRQKALSILFADPSPILKFSYASPPFTLKNTIKKIVSRYAPLANGLIATHLDLCLNYGHLLNITDQYKNLPFKFFGTGKTIPEDIEAATAERILAGIFQFGKKEK